MRRMGQVRPVSVEVLDHVHGAVLELSAEFGAHDVRFHRGIGRSGLAKQLDRRPELLLAETGFESHAVDVEDHGLLLFCCDGEAPGARGATALSCGYRARRGCLRGLRGTTAAISGPRVWDWWKAHGGTERHSLATARRLLQEPIAPESGLQT